MASIENKEFENKQSIEKISEDESIKILENADINGVEFRGKKLTPEDLANDGIFPEFKVKINDTVDCYLSKAYEVAGKRLALNAFIKDPNTSIYTVRSYYRSNSQGLWRYLPDYKANYDDKLVEQLSWFGKGFSEESTTLPADLQKSLAQITENEENLLPTQKDGSQIDYTFDFVGTAPLYDSYISKKTNYYSGEVKQIPNRLNGYVYHGQLDKTPPEKVNIDYQQSPDFSKIISTWKQNSDQYGEVTFEVFSSNNGKLKYTFCKDLEGKAWIGNIEDDSKITSIGIHESWIKYDDLTTPLAEYYYTDNNGRIHDQTAGYGGKRIGESSYVDMFENYLSKIPVIQEYIDRQHNNETFIPNKNNYQMPEIIKEKPTIENSSSFNELYLAIESLEDGGIQGSQMFYGAPELIQMIEDIRTGKLKNKEGGPGTNYLTSTFGLRQKVNELLNVEKNDDVA